MVPTLTVLTVVYTHISTILLPGVVTGPITRFPFLYAVLPTHVESVFFSAGYCGAAVIIAVAPVAIHIVTGTVHLGGTAIFFSITGEVGHTIEYEGEDAGTACVRPTDCVAAGAGRLCTDVST